MSTLVRPFVYRLLLLAPALIALLLLASRAEAACTISASGVAFGTYDVFSPASTDSTGSVTFRCGNNDRNITMTLTTGASGTYTSRTMKRGTESLTYSLFTTAAETRVWGDGTAATEFYQRNNPPNNQDVVVTIYGHIVAGQDVSPGAYSDTIIATINF